MKILAIDTATEQCSVAIVAEGKTWSRVVPTARSHAEMILPMVDEVLKESGYLLEQFDALAFGRGPGSFTGVRIAVGVVQGLAFSYRLPVVAVSNLAAVAQQACEQCELSPSARILVCMDARMREVYWGIYEMGPDRIVTLVSDERVEPPEMVRADPSSIACGVGTGWRAYPELRERFPALHVDDSMLPRALEVARLGQVELSAGRTTSAAHAQPVYLRDQVAALPQKSATP
jgi:tRNA threonylcarbamoyladenosine biosynthesis protein TsaB